jgi:tetratricopeptide (TPR) repeat protein
MARVDSLPEEAKEVLQAGSAIEREFSYELIKTVTDLPDQDLLSCLSVLKDSELVYERGIFPQSSYVFRHALTREVVYDAILTSKKRKFHDRIAAAIERIYSENLTDHYGMLGEHYLASENYQKAAGVLHLAGKRAARRGSLDEAIAHAEVRITALERLPKPDSLEESVIDARMILGLYNLQINRHVEAYHAVEPVVDLAAKRTNPKRLSMIYCVTGTYHSFVREDFERGLNDLKNAVEISEAAQALGTYAQANFWWGLSLYLSDCYFENALNSFEKALQLAVAANNLWAISSIKSNIGMLRYHQGAALAGLEMSTEAVRLAEESGDIFSKCRAYVSHGLCLYTRGSLKGAADNLARGAEFSNRVDYFFWNSTAHLNLAEISHVMGDFRKAVFHYAEGCRLIERSEIIPSLQILGTTGLALADIMNGKQGVDLESLCRNAIKVKPKLYEGWIRRYLGEIFLNIDGRHFSEAQHWIERAIQADERNGMRWHMARDVAVYAELFKRKGDKEKAKEQLGKAIDIYKECGADGWVKRAEEELEKLS